MFRISQICISGAFGEGNFGDDLLLLGYLNFLTKNNIPQRKIKIISKTNDKLNLQIQLHFPGIKIIQKDKFGIIITKYNIFAGGTQFYTFALPPQKKFPILDRIVFHLTHKRILSKKSIMLNVGLGPFEIAPSDRLQTKICDAYFVSVRDKVSLEHCNNFRGKNFHYGADIGYVPELYTKLNTKKIGEERSSNARKLKALIILRDWPEFDFNNVISNIKYTLKKRNISYAFYIMSPIKDSAFRSALESSNTEYSEWDEGNLDEALLHISNFDFLITSRYHAVVTAATFTIPSICINIEPKLAIVSKQLNTNLTIDMNVTTDSLERVVDTLQNSYEDVKKRLNNSTEHERKRFYEFSESFKPIAKELVSEIAR
ncbi:MULTISPECIES: polysaccharide pyruvyl transferase family protein [unclassified Pseudomonas]|uniref:polysaccharide pyruvyl transferase family protein n=1 Tax=unclassified Pseudomonas TaxID=196821 RepID=UPI001CC132B9|nr:MULTISPECIES: polysaccharide pyruvyl transferase family protein [unclassified Pseudomonas]